MANNSWSKNKNGIKYWIENNIENKLDNNTIKPIDIDQWLEYINCNTVMDAPIASCWEIFVKFYPNAKVIVVTRDYVKMHESLKKMFESVFLKWWFDLIICKISNEMYWLKYVFMPKGFKKDGWTLNELMECESSKFIAKCENKLQLIDDLMHKQGNKTITIGVDEFKALFSTAQLNRGWTKPQLDFINERVKNGS